MMKGDDINVLLNGRQQVLQRLGAFRRTQESRTIAVIVRRRRATPVATRTASVHGPNGVPGAVRRGRRGAVTPDFHSPPARREPVRVVAV